MWHGTTCVGLLGGVGMRSRWCSIASSVFLAAKLTDFLRVSRHLVMRPPPAFPRFPRRSSATRKRSRQGRQPRSHPPTSPPSRRRCRRESAGRFSGRSRTSLWCPLFFTPRCAFLAYLSWRCARRRMAGSDWVGAVEFLSHPVSRPNADTRRRSLLLSVGPLRAGVAFER